MAGAVQTGIYGKLPAHGDFIYRNLPTRFINVWDSWLQSYVSSSQEQIGPNWLDIYLTSPIWRFAFSPGVIDENGWAGILLPSVDRVGRYFPFSIVRPLSPASAPAQILVCNSAWFEALESAALAALEGAQQLEELLPELNSLPAFDDNPYRFSESAPSTLGTMVRLQDEHQPVVDAIPNVLDVVLKDALRSYSIWHTRGSQDVDPCVFHAPGLPQRRGIAAMLDGQWQQRGWREPLVPASYGVASQQV